MSFSLKRITARVLAAGLLAGSLAFAGSAGAQAAVSPAQFASYTSEAGVHSNYHVYAENIDWNQPVGVVFYLDGDYWQTNQSKVHSPDNSQLLGMAKVANERNMVFVPVISPDKDATGNGITWWQSMDANGDWFRSFASSFIAEAGLDSSNVWTIGHSGGAEITGFELLADSQDSWRTGGGSVMVGGGNSNGLQTLPSETAQDFSLQWYIGSEDGVGATWPVAWSAYGAAENGHSIYSAAGFKNVDFTVIPGIEHHNYDFPVILEEALDKVEPQLIGGIGAYFYTHGGAQVFGEPVANEYAITGGAQQLFRAANGVETLLVWSAETGEVTPVAYARF
ncbi:hypothetical protein [Rothia sp. 88186D007BW]